MNMGGSPKRKTTPGTLMTGLGLVALVFIFSLALPVPISNDPASVVLEAEDGTLLGARIAADGQWRFPGGHPVPEKIAQCVVFFEDEWFCWHPGINPVSMIKAAIQNWKAGKVVRGGSTLPMQLMRISRKGKPRTYVEKLIEVHAAIRLTFQQSKEWVLGAFMDRAPFGGNVIGLDAASWRYYGKDAAKLSWGEAATLAILPNAPGLIHPGRNRSLLLAKRNALLRKLKDNKVIDTETWQLAIAEPIPLAPLPLPQMAPELLTTLGSNMSGRIATHINASMQEQVRMTMNRHKDRLVGNGIHNMAVLIIDNIANNVIAYAGNAPSANKSEGSDVDVIPARRSPGSTLKPFLYGWALQDGLIWPRSLMRDIPTQYGSYRPENFDKGYHGLIPAEIALATSMNVPMVRLLHLYGVERFLYRLKEMGFGSLTRGADHYGLSLILGGGDVALWELTQAYGQLARILRRYTLENSRYNANDMQSSPLLVEKTGKSKSHPNADRTMHLRAGTIWQILEAMRLPERPEEGTNWTYFESSRPLAWKTGTSFGFKDAWAIGVMPEYTVGVWVGNADAEPRSGLTGLQAAAPLLFDILYLLPATTWFSPPYDDMKYVGACKISGSPPNPYCPIDSVWVPASQVTPDNCPYHQQLLLDPSGSYLVNSSCLPPANALKKNWFVIPPVEAFYYAPGNPQYMPPPPLSPDCLELGSGNQIQIIYPTPSAALSIPLGLNGERQALVFTAAHRQPGQVIHWHLDNFYLGSTREKHQWKMNPEPGIHTLTLVDEAGFRIQSIFRVLE
jgi:penicillin-binding protein 1C